MSPPPYTTRLTAELIGTFGFFFLGFSGIAASVDLPGAIGAGGVAAGFGLGLALMIFTFGHISGGHFNPAVTAGLAAGKQFPAPEVLGYWGAQIIGGVGAAAAANIIYSDEIENALVSASNLGDGRTFALELIATAFFVMLISAVATDRRAPWYGVLAPLAIGGFIFTAATVLGPFTSGSFNPARSLAPAILAAEGTQLWLFVVAPLVGGIIGGLIYGKMRRAPGSPEEGEEVTV